MRENERKKNERARKRARVPPAGGRRDGDRSSSVIQPRKGLCVREHACECMRTCTHSDTNTCMHTFVPIPGHIRVRGNNLVASCIFAGTSARATALPHPPHCVSRLQQTLEPLEEFEREHHRYHYPRVSVTQAVTSSFKRLLADSSCYKRFHTARTPQ